MTEAPLIVKVPGMRPPCLPSQSQHLCLAFWFPEGSWVIGHYYSPGSLLQAVGDRKHVLLRLYPIDEGL